MGRLEELKESNSEMYPILKEHTSLFDLLERAKEMSKNINPEYRFIEERHNDVGGYENAIINGENNSVRP